MRRKRPNVLSNRQIAVSYTRNGLTFEVSSVPAPDGALVAKALMDGVRGLIAAGYDELVPDGGTFHSNTIDQPEEADDADFILPPVAKSKPPKTVGFQ